MKRRLPWLLLFALACRAPAVEGTQPEALRVDPAALDFGRIFVGARPQRQVVVTNPNRSSSQVALTLSAPFVVAPAVLTLGGGESASVAVTFSPTVEGAAASTLEVVDANGRVLIAVGGLGQPPLNCPETACASVTFDPEAGVCVTQQLADGTSCTATESCFSKAECSSGVCVGQLSTCDDGDPCTVDACGASGCVHPVVECAVTSPCAVALCVPDAGCQQRAVDDGVSCGSSDCASALICLNGQCLRRTRPNAALDCSYDDLHSSENDVCAVTRGAEVRCWGTSGPRFVNGPRKVPTPPGFHFIPNHGGPMYGVDSSGMPWRYEAAGVFGRVPSDGGRYPGPVTMTAGGVGEELLLVGDGLAGSEDVTLFIRDAGLRAVVGGDPTLLLFSDGGVQAWGSGDQPDFGEPLESLEAAGSLSVCGRTGASVRCFTRGPFSWSETRRADAGALVGGFDQQACLGTAGGLVSCGLPVGFPAGLSRLTRNHGQVLCGLLGTGDVYCHVPPQNGLALSPGGLGDLTTLPLEPVEVPLPESAVAVALSDRSESQSYAATASGIWAWGGSSRFFDGDGGGATPRLILPVEGVTKLLAHRRTGFAQDTISWLDRRGRLFEGTANGFIGGVSQVFGCSEFAGGGEDVCGVTTDGGWFWSNWLMHPQAVSAPFTSASGGTFLVSDGGVVTHPMPTDLSTAAAIPLPAAARFVSNDCVVLVDGRVFCDLTRSGARHVTGLLPAREVFGGFDGGCALVGSNGVQCWGSNRFGRLANETAGSATPVFVTMPEPVVQLVGTSFHACALLRSGKVRCWGDNRFGHLGLEPRHSTTGPVRVTH